ADAIQDIAALTPKSPQPLLFSATYPDNIEQLSNNLHLNPLAVTEESVHQASSIEQHVILFERGNKDAVMARALQHFDIQQAVVFCNTKQAVEDTTHSLRNLGYLALALHGDLEQRDRDEVYARFKQNSAHFLVATDVAARGLDVDDLQAVINYELPRDPEVYVHRIGRTGKQGLALRLATNKEDYKRAAIADQMGQYVPLLAANGLTGRGDICNPPMVPLCLAAGRKDKRRPGDILGALTGKGGIDGKA